ncbi:MAG: hypothetical protein GF335_00580 [Candidatus Moranbacteria bacterium]|nr:hypothetical protein [Candidatus Moranbacteria bacterium]
MFSIKKDIKRYINRIGVSDELEAFMICKYAKDCIDSICKDRFNQAQPVKYIRHTNTLEISLNNVLIGNTIRSQKAKIIEKINEKMGGFYVEKIRYRMF